MTSFLRASLASSRSIFWSLASSTDLLFATVVEGQVGVLEELALPLVKERGVDGELIAQVGDRMPSNDGASR